MILTGNNDDLFFGDFVNEAMLIVDPTRPIALSITFERFGLSDTVKCISSCIGYHSLQS